ncbi:hypothetical protein MHYP_G00288680 [Metynnis hypsauchen]
MGYLELDVMLCNKVMPYCGILVMKDPNGASSTLPGVMGMNVISWCYEELFGAHGPSFFSLPSVVQALGPVIEALQQCHQSAAQVPRDPMGTVRVRGTRVVRIPGGVMKLVASTCPELSFGRSALFEPPKAGLPAGLLASHCLVHIVKGTVHVPVVNVGTTDALLYPHTCLGSLSSVQVVSLPPGVTKVRSTTATVSSQLAASSAQNGIEAVDLSALTDQEQKEVKSLLQKYSSIFSADEGYLGCRNLIEQEIALLDNVLVWQSKTRKDAFPLPRIEESLDALSGARWFSTLDLASGYNQVLVAEQDKPKTAFCTPFGFFEWNHMAFGLCNAPSTFQRLMQQMFGDQQYQSLLLYLDDIIVFSSVFQHLQRLEVVLGHLQKKGLKAKLGKQEQEVSYLGHVISRQRGRDSSTVAASS